MRTRQQEWAQDAYRRVARRAREPGADRYKDMALRFPVLVRQAGLAQALAFVQSRGEEAHRALAEDLAQTLGYGGLGILLEAAQEAELLRYLRLTREVLLVAEWYKRFAQALVEEAHG
ncbi:type III-B CRISPR module-associated protein Cmr5 [Thermus sp.]|uniref:type III-B CRISPR module-associated protein Cmr5 n=1 Tax=Thermus sp. TaxID=275 RepID=UPI00307F21EE